MCVAVIHDVNPDIYNNPAWWQVSNEADECDMASNFGSDGRDHVDVHRSHCCCAKFASTLHQVEIVVHNYAPGAGFMNRRSSGTPT